MPTSFASNRARHRARSHTIAFVAVSALCLVASAPMRAQVVNGGFETGNFTGFSTIGNTSIQTSAFGITPPEGTHQALLSTPGGAAGPAALDTFLNLPAGTLEGAGFTNGSAIKQTFNAMDGDMLSFKYNFLTNENPAGSSNAAGFGFLGFINNIPFLSIGLGVPAGALTAAPGATGFAHQTGYLTSDNIFGADGSYTLSFVVLNNDAVASGLLIDDLTLNGLTNTPPPATVPEAGASSALLLASGVAALLLLGAASSRGGRSADWRV